MYMSFYIKNKNHINNKKKISSLNKKREDGVQVFYKGPLDCTN